MKALIVVDAQNEFSAGGQRPVADHPSALAAIRATVVTWRERALPIAWIQHHNRPQEEDAFRPGAWGAELSVGLGPLAEAPERLFVKQVFGAFTGTDVGPWLEAQGVTAVHLVGFLTHMCVSTTAREGLMRGLAVSVDPLATAAHDLEHPGLGRQSAEEVRRSALLQLADLGVTIGAAPPAR